MDAENQVFKVWTQNESGFTEYHEENDETDDFEVALQWLNADDCIGGHIKLNGKIIVSKDYDGNLEFSAGWCKNGLKALLSGVC